MFFSIIIPVYNAEKYIAKMFNQLRQQEYKDFEVYFINDGSKDNSHDIMKNLICEEKNFHLIDKENEGPSAARNVGLKYIKGQYVLFLDADDYISDKYMLKNIHRILQNKDFDLLIYGYKVVNKTGNVLKEIEVPNRVLSNSNAVQNSMFEISKLNAFPSVWNKVYKAEIIKHHEIRFAPELYIGEDLYFNLCFLKKCSTLRIINKAYYGYMQSDNSIIRRYNSDKYEQLLTLFKYKRKVISTFKENQEGEFKAYFDSEYQRIIVSCVMENFKKTNVNRKVIIKDIHYMLRKYQMKNLHKNFRFLSTKRKIVNLIFVTRNEVLLYLFSKICFNIKKNAKKYTFLDE